jgi:hypothetical protein
MIAHKLDAEQEISDDLNFNSIKEIIERWIALCNTFGDSLMVGSNDWSMVRDLLKELTPICKINIPLNDSVAKSKSLSEPQIKKLSPTLFTQSLLSKRLGISSSKISQSKRKTGDKKLDVWSIDLDPDGIAWKYDSKTKKYIPAIELSIQQKSNLLLWISEIEENPQSL